MQNETNGYSWTVVLLKQRDAYMAALEEASVPQDIVPLRNFLGQLVDDGLRGKTLAKVPAR